MVETAHLQTKGEYLMDGVGRGGGGQQDDTHLVQSFLPCLDVHKWFIRIIWHTSWLSIYINSVIMNQHYFSTNDLLIVQLAYILMFMVVILIHSSKQAPINKSRRHNPLYMGMFYMIIVEPPGQVCQISFSNQGYGNI